MFGLGVDSYSYHRLLGAVRTGEVPAVESLPNGSVAVVGEVRRCGAEFVSLETMFLNSPRDFNSEELRSAAGPIEVGLSWGGFEGLAFGSSKDAVEDLGAWLSIARDVGIRLVRIVVGGPRLRGHLDAHRLRATARALASSVDEAAEKGVELALENHGDLNCDELIRLLDETGRDNLGVCFDTANAIRVGDDPILMLKRVMPVVRMVHLKDCSADWRDPIAGPVSVEYGEGVIPVAAIVDQLAAASFAGPICVELGQLPPDADERLLVRRGLAWLHKRRLASGAETSPSRAIASYSGRRRSTQPWTGTDTGRL
jgi:sugar phosphate isomerase/epimerase